MTGPVARFERPNAIGFALTIAVLAFLVSSFWASDLSLDKLLRGLPGMGRILGQMFPPALDGLDRILLSLLGTFQMAIAGVVLGLAISLPLAILAADGLSPHPAVKAATRTLISFFRTVPDLVWALIFVIAVGLGPPAGVLTIMIDTIGYAGRFFAEAMEETDKGSREALSALGASRTGVIASSVVPNALPSFIATSLFCVEKATRASVVLGLVGAGGIGVELKVAFDLFDYQTAATIILVIFALVVVVEQVGALLRRRLL
ncbi:phosphonate ABC transporter, permease protein PhnE [Prosthecodimorpha staleyi]|uniref:Phosphonate ABC transporter, permease protein PhnE n=1 Tax=Prosthecodimorpha staleyi TaxID=2840188 RepID=A0A947D8X4_9HYPH|nr:phosphonate ABC transporter, permease protein PhnE [Prosthecodimorpha staleyi]MBT9293176.1 phosphonate ABC transporter, permease protein PhnE [Prosthecodimorpha staleyi]